MQVAARCLRGGRGTKVKVRCETQDEREEDGGEGTSAGWWSRDRGWFGCQVDEVQQGADEKAEEGGAGEYVSLGSCGMNSSCAREAETGGKVPLG